MDLGLTDRVAIVTGGSKGLGLASALALAGEGAKVLISSRGEQNLAAAGQQIEAAGGECLTVAADMADPSTPARLVQAATERWERLDVVVANTGGPKPGTTLGLSDDDIRGAVDSVLVPAVRLVREAAPHLRSGGWGRICCITSYGVELPLPSLPLSNLARAALFAWVRTASGEMVGDGVTINLICPGPHATDRMKELGGAGGAGPMGDPADFGRLVAYLCADAAGFVTGTSLVVDGGATAAQR
ncbi:MAG TPA: SDR family oxidoreductase [Acidimicrobiales bacterium]|nr:SDR family oxidoreductase [Acidimicrobiales bacterium]